jgi:multidrug resistance efflux pump
MDDETQRTAAEAARLRIVEVDAAIAVAANQLTAAKGSVDQAIGMLEQSEDELARQLNLQARNSDVVAGREIDRLQNLVESRQGGVDAAAANQQALQTQIDVLLPAQRATAVAALAQAQAELDKTLVVAGVDGMIEQFQLQVGDFVSSVLRPAGILVPDTFEEGRFVAGFGQLTGQIIKPGMLTEVSCASLPFKIIPMVVTGVQPVIAAGQFRPSDRLVDL